MLQATLRHVLLLLPLLAFGMGRAMASPDNQDAIALHQRLGDSLPLDTALIDDVGERLRLADLTNRGPTLLLFGYFRCRKLCGVLRDDVLATLAAGGARAGRDYDLLAVSVDPEETPADAARAKADSMARFPTPGAQAHWRFLTGSRQAITRVAQAAGFDFVYDETRKNLAHPIGVVIATPPGRISAYLPGLDFDAAKLHGALARAAAGGIATPASSVLLLCFDFDQTTGRYTLAIMKALRLSVIGFLLAGAGLVVHAARRREAS
jgi:protein SCO1/2